MLTDQGHVSVQRVLYLPGRRRTGSVVRRQGHTLHGRRRSARQHSEGTGPGRWAGASTRVLEDDMLPEPMRHASGHGGSAVFISAEFIDSLLEHREPEIDLYESLAMTVPGIVAHRSALSSGQQLEVPFDPAGP